MSSTKVELVTLLLEKQKKFPKRSQNLAYVIQRALAGKYHDWESDLDTPKSQLVQDLEACRKECLADVIDLVKHGEFDEDPTVQQIEELRVEMGPEAFDKLMGRRDTPS